MLKNTVPFSYLDLTACFNETSILNCDEKAEFRGIANDSREVEQNNIFIALKGEHIDGHTKVAESFEKGAGLAIVDKYWYKENYEQFKDKPFLVVSDTLAALGKLANWHRSRFSYPVIAIGGSNGKTTTKEMTAFVLSQKLRVLKTFENYNNQLGVPLMLLQMTDEFDAVVLEIGTNEPGEIPILTAIAEPSHGLITNIGKEHLEKLIDLDGVEMEEAFLFGYLFKTGGVSFINLDDQRLGKYINIIENKVTYGQSENVQIKAKISLIDGMKPSLKFKIDDQDFLVKMKTTGYTTGLNGLAAAAVATNLGLSFEEIKKGLELYEQEVTHGYARMTLEQISGYYIINDCYNANPDSMKAAIDTIEKVRSNGKKYMVLGDMRELGKAAFAEHKEVLNLAAHSADEVFCLGEEMKTAKKALKDVKNIHHFTHSDELLKKLYSIIKPYDYILVKGSRGMRMESIVNCIKDHIKGRHK